VHGYCETRSGSHDPVCPYSVSHAWFDLAVLDGLGASRPDGSGRRWAVEAGWNWEPSDWSRFDLAARIRLGPEKARLGAVRRGKVGQSRLGRRAMP